MEFARLSVLRITALASTAMQDDLDDALKVEVLTNMLRMGRTEASELVENLATRLMTLLPEITSVERGGFFLSSQRPVKTLTIRFPDTHFVLDKDKFGISSKVVKIVRGVALKTSNVSLDEWISMLAGQLSQAAQSDAKTRAALQDFGVG